TMVGNEAIRGVSGGQKKRVTTGKLLHFKLIESSPSIPSTDLISIDKIKGEMLVGPSKALFMDEISTGLDSSTTFQIVNSIKQYIRIMKGTAVISLLQPPPETYDLFDDIMLLSEG
ncbi:hypothetical protein J0J30_23060, partial [Vibrio vulnificus]|nr:hypothetical protein [Vibrio vulnificus]